MNNGFINSLYENLVVIPVFSLFFLWCDDFGTEKDSLSEKSNHYLVAKLDSLGSVQYDDTLVWAYLNAYINNAKKNRDYETLFYGYREATFFSKYKKLIYADSAINTAKQTGNIDFIGNAYLTKGIAHYSFKNYKSALDNYIEANNILSDSKNKYLQNKTLLFIASIKNYLGYYEDALDLLYSAQNYFEGKNDSSNHLAYIRCLYEIGEIYQKTGQYEKARDNNLLGLQESRKYKEKIQEQYFNLAIGIDDYNEKNYAIAIRNINKALPAIRDAKDFNSEAKGDFYLAKSYLGLGQVEKVFFNFQQVDSLFVKNQYLDNEFRESYEWLINYYKQAGNKDKQLYYINQLLKVDEINAENNKYLAYKINKEYDTQRLLEEKKQLERSFSNWQYYGLAVIFVLMDIGVWLFFRNRKIKLHNKQLKTQYGELLSQNELLKIKNQKETGTKKRLQDIPEDVAQDILKRLDLFEQQNEFLNPKIDQRYLAEKLKTNTSYLSKIINSYKGVSFNTY